MIKRRLAGWTKERIVVGFLGMYAGVGTTHLAIAAANYIVTRWGLTAAVIELGDCACIGNMNQGGIQTERFSIDGVYYYPNVEPARLPELLNEPYQYLILDFGCSIEGMWKEFLRCDKQFLVGSLCPWHMKKTEDCMTYLNELYSLSLIKNLYVLLNYKSSYEKKRIQYKYHVPVWNVPYIADPFWLVKDQLIFFQEILLGG